MASGGSSDEFFDRRYLRLEQTHSAVVELSSDELLQLAKNDWGWEEELHRRRPQYAVPEQVLAARATNQVVRHLDTTLLKWPEIPSFGIRNHGTLYGTVYKGRWLFSRYIIVKHTRVFDRHTNRALLHELEMADRFKAISPMCLGLNPIGLQMRISYEYLPLDLKSLMDEDLSINYNIPYQLAKIMAEVSGRNYMLREFRLEKFMGRLSELKKGIEMHLTLNFILL